MLRKEERWMNLLSWIHGVNLFAGSYLLLAGILKAYGLERMDLCMKFLWLFLPVIGSWGVIRRMQAFWQYALFGTGMTVLIAAASKDVLSVIWTVVIFLIRGYARVLLGRRNDPDSPGESVKWEIWEIPTILDKPNVRHWILLVIYYVGIIFTKQYGLLKWMFGSLVLEIFITYIFSSLDQLKTYISENHQIAHLPIKTMRRMQQAVLCMTVFLLILFVLPSVFYGKEPLKALAEQKWEVNYEGEIELPEMEAFPQDSMESLQALAGNGEQTPLNPAIEKLLNLLAAVFMVVGCILILWGIWKACRSMMNAFEKGQETDEVISLDEADETLVKKIQRIRRQAGKKSAKQKIRKVYKKMIEKNLNGSLSGSETPTEAEERVGFWKQESWEELHQAYEKARYSDAPCEETDAEAFISASTAFSRTYQKPTPRS